MPDETINVGSADCVLLGGEIYTMIPGSPQAEAVAISDGRISYVGDEAGARRMIGDTTRVIDLQGKVALPGFIESHTHIAFFGKNLERTDCREARSVEDVVSALKADAAQTPTGEWVVGHTYDDTLLTEMRHPTREDLDRASMEHPIFLTHISAHNAVANTAALEKAGITTSTKDPADGSIDRDGNGEPTGILWEWAQNLVREHLPEDTVDDIRRHLRQGARHYLAAGVTSTVDAAVGLLNGIKEAEAFAKVAETGEVPLRLGASILYPLWKELQRGEEPGLAWPGDPDRVRPVSVKLFQDGSIQLRTAALREPYHGEPDSAHEPNVHFIWPQAELEAMVSDAHTAGWQFWIHGNGDAAIGSILDAYERALSEAPRADRRHRIEHCQTVGEDQLDRMENLEVTTSFFAAHVWYWGDRHRDIFLGPERAARLDPLASALERGIRFGLHNDTPVTPISPLLSVGTAVSRLTSSGEVLGAEQAITVHQALRSMTLDSAYLAHEEDRKGSLEKGKLGDVVILSEDPYRVAPQEIKDIPIDKTMLGGEVVYEAR